MNLSLDAITGLLITLYIVFLSMFAMLTSIRMRKRREVKEKTFNQISIRLNNKTIERGDLLIVYNGFIRKAGVQWSFVRFLEELCYYLATKTSIDSEGDSEGTPFGLLFNRIKTIYEEEQKVEPFDELDDSTKILLSDISKGVSINDKDYVEGRLGALSVIIKENERKYHKDYSINRWSLGLAVAGLVISIILGYVTLTRKAHMSEEDIKIITETIENSNKGSELIFQAPELNPKDSR